jgi:hypothetical protein
MPRLLPFDAAAWRPHALHAPEQCWPETNCYVDLWIEILHALGAEPMACLGFTVEQDFEGDQFTFFKFPPEDLRTLFGLAVRELAIYGRVEHHVATQLERGNLVLVEMDSFYLPDTRGTAYRQEHVKTTVGVANLDLDGKALGYFHNGGYYQLSGDDFDGVFRRLDSLADNPDILYPYVEFVKHEGPMLQGRALADAAVDLLREHLRRRPTAAVASFRADFPRHVETLLERPMAYFHLYAFNVLRQFGANFGLLGAHCEWLTAQGETGLEEAVAACERMASAAKALQFQLARAVNRKKPGDFSSSLDEMERAHDSAMAVLVERYG